MNDDLFASVQVVIDSCVEVEFPGRDAVLELSRALFAVDRTLNSSRRVQLIVNIEGLDGVGKSTCLENLETQLASRGVTSKRFKTPTPELAPYRAHFDAQPARVRRAYYQLCNVHLSHMLETGVADDVMVALVDRWWASTYAYSNAESEMDAHPPHRSWPACIVAPDLCFLLVLADDTER